MFYISGGALRKTLCGERVVKNANYPTTSVVSSMEVKSPSYGLLYVCRTSPMIMGDVLIMIIGDVINCVELRLATADAYHHLGISTSNAESQFQT